MNSEEKETIQEIKQEIVVSSKLWTKGIDAPTYSSDPYQSHLLEQYKLYVDSAEKVSERRNLANSFYLAINTLLLGGIGLIANYVSIPNNPWSIGFTVVVVVAVFGSCEWLCWVWRRQIRAYQQLNSAKFKVIAEFEDRLPAGPYVRAEWKALGEGKDPKLYTPFSQIERDVPIVFMVLYAAITLFAFVLLLGPLVPTKSETAMPTNVTKEELEGIADTQHAIWSHWMDYLFSVSEERSDGTVVIPKELAQRWKKQVKTEYAKLSEDEKESDREQALKVLARLRELGSI